MISCHVWHSIHPQSAHKITECLIWVWGWGLHAAHTTATTGVTLHLDANCPAQLEEQSFRWCWHSGYDAGGHAQLPHFSPGTMPSLHLWFALKVWQHIHVGRTPAKEQQPTSHLQQVFCGTKIPFSWKKFVKIHQISQPVCPVRYFL